MRLGFGVHYWIYSFGISEYLGRGLLLFPGKVDMIVRTIPNSSVSLDKPAWTQTCFLKFAASSLLAGAVRLGFVPFRRPGTRTDDDLSRSAFRRIILLSLTAAVTPTQRVDKVFTEVAMKRAQELGECVPARWDYHNASKTLAERDKLPHPCM